MAHFLLKKHHDLFAVVFCWAIAVMIGILTGAGISGMETAIASIRSVDKESTNTYGSPVNLTQSM